MLYQQSGSEPKKVAEAICRTLLTARLQFTLAGLLVRAKAIAMFGAVRYFDGSPGTCAGPG